MMKKKIIAAAEGACAVTSYDTLSGIKSLEELEKRIKTGSVNQR